MTRDASGLSTGFNTPVAGLPRLSFIAMLRAAWAGPEGLAKLKDRIVSNDEFLREVDEDYRRDRATALLRKYGSLLVAAGVVLVAGVAGYNWWQGHQVEQAKGWGNELLRGQLALREALPQPGAADADAAKAKAKGEEAATIFAKLTADGNSGYRTLAEMGRAAALADMGQRDAAIAAYDKLADDSGLAAEYRDAARLFAGRLLVDAGPAAPVEAKLGPLASGNGPYRFAAREMIALAQLKDGKTDEARKNFQALSDDATAPTGYRQRAAEFLKAIGG